MTNTTHAVANHILNERLKRFCVNQGRLITGPPITGEEPFLARRAALLARGDGLIKITVHPAVTKLALQFKEAKR
jgi:hypothetical protein